MAVASLGVPSRQQPLGEVQAVLPPAGLAGVAAVVAAAGDTLGLAPATTGVGEAPVDTAGAVGLGLVLVVFEAPATGSVLPQPHESLGLFVCTGSGCTGRHCQESMLFGLCSEGGQQGTPPNEPTIPETMDMACKDSQTSQSCRNPRYDKGAKFLEQMKHGRLKSTASDCSSEAWNRVTQELACKYLYFQC